MSDPILKRLSPDEINALIMLRKDLDPNMEYVAIGKLLEFHDQVVAMADAGLIGVRPAIAKDAAATPIPMILTCPMCSARHIDRGEFATKPHHTHACQSCGMVWRPAIAPTVGVEFLPGFRDTDLARIRAIASARVRLDPNGMASEASLEATNPETGELYRYRIHRIDDTKKTETP